MLNHKSVPQLWRRYAGGNEALWAFVSQTVTSGGNFLTTAILVRTTGLSEFGRFSMAFLVMTITRNLMQATVLTPMSSIGPKVHPRAVTAYRGFILAVAGCFACGTSIIIFIASIAIGHFLEVSWITDLAFPLGLATFLASMADFFQRKLYMERRGNAAALVDVIRFGLLVTGLLACALLFPSFLSAKSALGFLATASLSGGLFGALFFGSMTWRRAFSSAIWVRHFSMTRWLAPSTALSSLQGPGVILFASMFFPEAVIGGLRAMQNISNILLLPMRAMENVAASMAARKFHAEGVAALGAFQNRVFLAMSLQTAILTAAAYLFREPIVETVIGIYTPELGALLVLYCIGSILTAVQFAFTVGLQSIERTKDIFFNNVLVTALTLFLFAATWTWIGIFSVPISRLLAMCMSCVLLMRSFSRQKAIYMETQRVGVMAGSGSFGMAERTKRT